ncbi:MAG TPA: ABC transporter ATP-binding protein, partial [Acidimicrobiia bacterium]|nr:ABC transporter ATP-binding protein [Acidimicrobiia bacterium]
LAALLSLVALVVTSFLVNPIAALAVVVGFVGVALILRPLRNTVRHRSREAADANMTFATDTTELAGTMLETRIFNAEPQATDRIVQRIRDASELDRRARFISMLTPALYQGMALLLVVGALAVIDAAGVAHLSSLGAIVLIMIRSLSYGQALQSNYQSIYQTAPYFERLGTETDRYAAAAQPRDGAPFDRVGRLELDGVGYEYEPGRLVLQDVSLAIEPGEIVGIVGPSGSGKSTLVQLLLRLRKPTCGRVLAAGRDVEELSLDEWYRHVSFVPQEPRLLADTVAANIRFFRSDLDDERVQHAARLANLHDEITAMRHGYDTPVGERGGQLSGGQRQRLSIARAVVEEPDLLVLDEPTSSLDVRSEALIRESLRDLSARATVVIIAHRMSTLDICDRIMVIRGGVLEGYDTPERLEAVNPFYRDALQLSGLRDGG